MWRQLFFAKKMLLVACMVVCVHAQAQVVPEDTLYGAPEEPAVVTSEDPPLEENNSDTVVALPEPVLRSVSADTMQRLKSQPEFAYMSYIDSVLRNKKELPQKRGKSSGSVFNLGIIRFIGWLFAIAAVLFIVYKLVLSDSLLFTRNKRSTVLLQKDKEVDTGLPLEELISKAVRDRNYRLATRYLYLQALQQLAEKHYVVLTPQKTNYAYVQELRGKPFQQAFSKITLQYEYVWFGGFILNDAQFAEVHGNFKKFEAQV